MDPMGNDSIIGDIHLESNNANFSSLKFSQPIGLLQSYFDIIQRQVIKINGQYDWDKY